MQRLGIALIQDIAEAYMDKPNRVQRLINFQTKFETLKTLMRIAGERQWIKGQGRRAVVKPYRTYCCNRTLTNFIAAVRKLNRARGIADVERAVCSINSYLGLLRQSDEYGMRCKILRMIEPRAYKWIYIKGRYEVVAIKNKYKQSYITKKRIRDGDY